MVYAQPSICPRDKFLWNFDIQMDHLISARQPDLIIINKKKRTCRIVDFAVPADHRIKLKESEKKDKYLNLARELKKLRNMKGTIKPIVIGAFGTVTKGLLKGLEDLEDEWKPFKLHYWEWPEYWEESWRLEETCCHSNSCERSSAKTDVKNSQVVNNNNKRKENKKIDKYLDPARELKRLWNISMTVILIVVVSQGIGKETRGIGYQRKNLDH